MAEALDSTGRAVLLSAITTIIGFISLALTPMRTIQTVGYSLAMGIVVVYVMTMVMVPNLTMMLDLKRLLTLLPKPSLLPLAYLLTGLN